MYLTEPTSDNDQEPEDERLRLILLCCHPALALDTQVALTLRLVAGLTTEEIAAAYLIPVPTLAARITRAKKKIRRSAIPLSIPDQLATRLDAVLRVIYLVFNEGYLSRSARTEVHRVDLCDEAIRLTDIVAYVAEDHAETLGLAALLRFTHARRDARFSDDELVLLDRQDRSRWRLDEIQAANRLLHRAMKLMQPGATQTEAVIASYHANARTAGDTDWARITALYDQLLAMRPSPVVALNRAISIAMSDGPPAGLAALAEIDGLDDYHLFHAARGELEFRNGQTQQAHGSFARAHELAQNPAERTYLAARLTETNRPDA